MKSALGKSAAMEPYYQYLVKEGYFETMKDVMLLAIMIGFKNEARIPVTKYGGDAIKEHIFKDDMDYLNVINIAFQCFTYTNQNSCTYIFSLCEFGYCG